MAVTALNGATGKNHTNVFNTAAGRFNFDWARIGQEALTIAAGAGFIQAADGRTDPLAAARVIGRQLG